VCLSGGKEQRVKAIGLGVRTVLKKTTIYIFQRMVVGVSVACRHSGREQCL
jgi:ABC-type transport system involved in Fe-S cluster assembly fused permease/ATPase subunit